jgi:hypothetical protein
MDQIHSTKPEALSDEVATMRESAPMATISTIKRSVKIPIHSDGEELWDSPPFLPDDCEVCELHGSMKWENLTEMKESLNVCMEIYSHLTCLLICFRLWK